MKKLLNHFTFLYSGWITFILFTKEDVNLAAKYTAAAFGFAFCVAVIPYAIKKVQEYYKNKQKGNKN